MLCDSHSACDGGAFGSGWYGSRTDGDVENGVQLANK